MTRRALGLAVLALAIVFPSRALATADFYASDGGTGDCMTASTPCAIGAATIDAGMTPGGANVHVIGPLSLTTELTLPPPVMGSTQPVHLIGSGSGTGGTFIDTAGTPALELNNGSTADNLRARATGADTVWLHYGSAITNSLIQNTGTGAAVNSVFSTSLPATVSHDSLDAPSGIAAIVGNGGPGASLVIQDSVLNGRQGLNHTGGVPVSVVLQRSTINASSVGLIWLANRDASVVVSSSVLHITGDGSAGVSVSSLGDFSTIWLIEDTIDGIDTTGASSGVNVGRGDPTPPMPLVANVTDTIVRGFSSDLLAQPSASPGTPGGMIQVARSDYSVAKGLPPTGIGQPGAIGFGTGNVNVDPLFVNRAAGNYALAQGSPLIDAGGSDPIDTGHQESATDRAGNPRIADGNGDGVAARDMGAYELIPPPASGGGPPPPGGSSLFRTKLGGGSSLLVIPPGVIKLPATCAGPAGGTCRLAAEARTVNAVSQALQRAKKRRKRILTVGLGTARIAAGRSGQVAIKLTARGRRLFRARKLRRVSILVTVAEPSGPRLVVKRTYALKAAPRRHRR